MFGFGAGQMYFTRTDVANSTPRKIGVLQDIQLDFSGEIKELYGQFQFPVDVARGKVKLEGKVKMAQISGVVFNEAYFGATATTGTLNTATETSAVPAATPFTIVVPNITGFSDLGVRYHNTQFPLKLVASAPATGEYSIAPGTGTYTFAAADEGVAIDIDYSYTGTAGGMVIPITNQLMGFAPRFSVVATQQFEGKQWTLALNACVSSKLSLPTKIDDYVINEMDFSAFADASGSIGALTINDLL